MCLLFLVALNTDANQIHLDQRRRERPPVDGRSLLGGAERPFVAWEAWPGAEDSVVSGCDFATVVG